MKLSRRVFLTGVAAVAAVAAAPVLPKVYASGGVIAPGVIYPPPVYPGPFLYLYPSQWKFFEASGFNMDFCRLIGQIPRTT